MTDGEDTDRMPEEYEETKEVEAELDALHQRVSARFTALLDRNGRFLHLVGGSQDLDITSLAALIAGSMAATGGLARLLGRSEFSILLHEGEEENLHVALVRERFMLVVLFDPRLTPLGLVRLKVKQCVERLAPLMERTFAPAEGEGQSFSLFSDVTEEEIDRLFQ